MFFSCHKWIQSSFPNGSLLHLTNWSCANFQRRQMALVFCEGKLFRLKKRKSDFGNFWRRIWTHIYINVNDNFVSKFLYFWETLSTMLLANLINSSSLMHLCFISSRIFFSSMISKAHTAGPGHLRRSLALCSFIFPHKCHQVNAAICLLHPWGWASDTHHREKQSKTTTAKSVWGFTGIRS